MKRLPVLLTFLLLAMRANAQDVDFGAFGDAGSLLTPTAPARGATPAPARGAAPNVPPPDRLVRLQQRLLQIINKGG